VLAPAHSENRAALAVKLELRPGGFAREPSPVSAPAQKAPPKLPQSQRSNATSFFAAIAELASRLHSQEIADHLMTALGQYRLRVKLHTLDRQCAVAQPHNYRTVVLA
jgi:hypothetical protein